MHEPFLVPPGCSVSYIDRIDEHAARESFPEIPGAAFVHVDIIADLDVQGLNGCDTESQDFVIACHVIEHLANPLRAVSEIFRTLKRGGHAVLAIPDKRYTFDRGRMLTSWEHLLEDYTRGVTESSDEHYLDFLRSAGPHVFAEAPENLRHHVERARNRREHSHVWTGDSFREHLMKLFSHLNLEVSLVFESTADENQIEYLSVWRKG